MRKKRILQLIGSFELGGSELQAVRLARKLRRDGAFEICVACLDRRGPLISEIDRLAEPDIPEFPLTSFYDLNFLRQTLRLRSFLKQNEIDLVHTHDFYSNIFGMFGATAARLGARIASKRETLSKTTFQFAAERQAFRLSKRIVANSHAVKGFLTANGVPERKIVTIYNGLDPARFVNREVERRKEAIGQFASALPPGAKLVTIVANMRSDVKDHRSFLRAAKKAAETRPEAVFILAGEGELREGLIAFADELGIGSRCRFIGSGWDIGSLLSVSDVGVLCSRSEGFSNAILEYMAAGLPVVATDVGGAREAVENGRTGYIVPPEDAEALAEAVTRLLNDDAMAREMGERGRMAARERFSAEAQLRAVMNLYDTLLASG